MGQPWTHPHQFVNPLNFAFRDPDPALALGAALEVINRDGLATNAQQTVIGLAQPIIKRGNGDAKSGSRVFWREKNVVHDR